ncbi:OmpA-like domain-containing protein [Novosphingobium lubricantis]
MKTFLFACAAPLAISLGLTAMPASAQLIGGGLGGVVSMPGGVVRGAGDIGVSRVDRSVTASTRANGAVTRTVRAPAPRTVNATGAASSTVTVPALPAARAGTVTSGVGAAAAAVAVPQVTGAVALPSVPNVEVRHAAIIGAGIAPVVYSEIPAYVERQYVVFQDDLRGTGVTVHKRGEQIVLELPSDVNFAFDKYDIQPRFYSVLNAVSRTLAKYPATYVDVYGHTDAIGSFAYNQTLSERRADAVADYLAGRSVNGARLHVEGFGKTQPVASNATVAGRAANRRVEIILTPVAA